MEDSQVINTNWMNEFRRPVNIVFLTVSIISILINFVLYFGSQKSREPVFSLDEEAIRVFNHTHSSAGLKVLTSNEELVDDDIYLRQGVFWNAGELPIRPEDVRSSVTLSIYPVTRVLDFSISKQIDDGVSQFEMKIVQAPTAIDSTAIFSLEWEYFDPGHGLRFQITYTGDAEAAVAFGGNILDVQHIANVNPWRGLGSRSVPAAILFCVFMFFGSIYELKNYELTTLKWFAPYIWAIAGIVLAVVYWVVFVKPNPVL